MPQPKSIEDLPWDDSKVQTGGVSNDLAKVGHQSAYSREPNPPVDSKSDTTRQKREGPVGVET